ncbi:MAG: tetratricopeptide repeat protein [Myxococcota bacterium]|nr:tetratricopeptide repeat protein [Myxococcota bacterium]
MELLCQCLQVRRVGEVVCLERGSELRPETWGSGMDAIDCAQGEVVVRALTWSILLLVLSDSLAQGQEAPRGPSQIRLPSKTQLVGERAIESGSYERAAEIFEEGLARKPRSKRFLAGLVRARALLNDCEEAEKLLLPQQHTRVANRDVLEALSACFARSGAYTDAVYWQTERVLLAPPTVAAFSTLASYHLGEGDRFAAREAFDRALELDPLHSSVFVLKLQIALGKGLVEEADRLLDEWDRVEPERSQMNWYLRARLALDVGDFEGAMRDSERSVVMGIQFSPVRVLRAEMYRRMGLLSNANEAANTIAKVNVGVVGMDSVRVRILADQGEFVEARETLGRLQQNAPLRADVVASAWYLAHKEGNQEEMQMREQMYAMVQSNPNRSLQRLIPFGRAGDTP